MVNTVIFPAVIESIRKDLSDLHDRIYNEADKLIKEYNPCNIHKLSNGRLSCADNPDGYDRNMLCCSACNEPGDGIGHWDNGCTVECLACKLFLCSTARKNNEELSAKLYNLQRIVEKTGLDSTRYFMSKNEWIDYCIEYEELLK